ncbi:MAG: type IV pilin [Methanoregula sp.]|nr:type IV pilin [Methanoregula sp.]
MKTNTENAVSPVVGVMLMLVVVIIIAAIVSAFAGGAVSGVKKVPQATITGKFSISDGLQIIHSGGDGLATTEIVFIIRDGPMFGPNLEQKTAQVLNKSVISDVNGQFLDRGDGTSSVTAFKSGDFLVISGVNATCSVLQPGVYASGITSNCISITDNVGKTFSLETSDNRGNLISKSDVIISP